MAQQELVFGLVVKMPTAHIGTSEFSPQPVSDSSFLLMETLEGSGDSTSHNVLVCMQKTYSKLPTHDFSISTEGSQLPLSVPLFHCLSNTFLKC